MHRCLVSILLGFALSASAFAAGPAPGRPWESSALTIESGVLWQIASTNQFPYKLVPTQLSWRSRQFFDHPFPDGSRIVFRHRLTLIGTWIQNGPESRYVGVAGSPSMEWWNKSGTWSFFTGIGGGFGLIDSRDIPGGQGQDFTLNYFFRAGIEHVAASDRKWSAGIMYQHMSNGGMTDPNPGINALGFTLGYSWGF